MVGDGDIALVKGLSGHLHLQRPLAFLDVESTGVSGSSDQIVDLAILGIDPAGSKDYRCKRVNPETPIPADAAANHGITDADVAVEYPFWSYARAYASV